MINERQAHLFCKDDISLIENYDIAMNDTKQTWHCHHRTEIWWNCTRVELIKNECYYNRKACELIFLTKADHARIHKKGKSLTSEHSKKISESNKGKHYSEELCKKMSESIKAWWARHKQGGKHEPAQMG